MASGNGDMVLLNLDVRDGAYQGWLMATTSGSAWITTPVKIDLVATSIELDTRSLLLIDPRSCRVVDEKTISEAIPGIHIPKRLTIKGTVAGDLMPIEFAVDGSRTGVGVLHRCPKDRRSMLTGEHVDWSQFKSLVCDLPFRTHVFRGQENSRWRLQTAFHRTGRADLVHFLDQDIQTLVRNLSARTRHTFDLKIPEQNGAFFHLIQHHGYPTPLLDWTFSPFVSVFFAYRNVSAERLRAAKKDDRVRVFIFDHHQWKTDYPQLSAITNVPPHFSIHEFSAMDNERSIPQQAVSAITPLDDIESYLQWREIEGKKTYLRALDLPLGSRPQIMRELSMMGITAGSLFPGLDGACEELKERFCRMGEKGCQ